MTDLYGRITDTILHQIETAEPGSWVCPWHRASGGLPRNALTGRNYRGINILSLWCGAQASGFADARWATYKQWSELGAQVRKGEHGTLVLFFKDLPRTDEKAEDDGDRRFVARASVAFNAAQVIGAPDLPALERGAIATSPNFDSFVETTRAIIRPGEAPCYVPSLDELRMPPRDRFRSADGYCSTLAHELVHWTGAKSRLDRDLSTRFGTNAYAAEELVAELGSAFVMAQLGLASEPHPQHAAYIASWLPLLRQDSRALLTAASMASRAAEFLSPSADTPALAAEQTTSRPNTQPRARSVARSRVHTWTRGARIHSHGW
jgi:antirestriction protein ArdC